MTLRAAPTQHLHRSNRLTTAPAIEPVTAAQLRSHLYADATELPDADADMLIEEAREYIEIHAGLAFITQTWRMTLDHWPGRREEWWDGVQEGSIAMLYAPDYGCQIELPRAPLQSVDSLNVYGSDDVAVAVTVADVFVVDAYSMPGRLSLRSGATWPIALRASNAIEINYIAGYGDAAADVPATMKRAIRMLAAKMYSERGDGCSVDDAYVSSGAKALVDNYRTVRI